MIVIALCPTSGDYNIAIGNTNGLHNTTVGCKTLGKNTIKQNTTGNQNTAIGKFT